MSAAATGDAAWRARRRARLLREGVLQGAVALVVVALLVGLAQNVAANLEVRQIKSGFGFLRDPAGFNIGELLFEYDARDSYLRAFAVGMANTLRVSIAGIVLASALGVIVGLMRLSHHALLSGLGGAYVEVFRNTPLLIQLLAIYLLATELLPDSAAALSLEGVALLSKQGLQIAVPASGTHALFGAGASGLVAGAAVFVAARRWLTVGAGLVGGGAGALVALLAWLSFGVVGGWSRPELDGFLISGGASLTPEFLALWLGLSLFTSASIAELVRAGALAVPIG
ncbi:MAG TPA: ABC transporter permease subunit, partial [Caldimonas sp.]|nr:ABC transporter permease subunit [Caldimonas sp.]